MIRKKTSNLPAVHASSLLFICALLPALLFKGPQIEFFAVTQIVLVIWLGWIFMHSHKSGLHIPKTALALCLTLFWLWLALSIAWSLAPSISVINFWWVGSLVLVFWLYTLTPNRDALWAHAAAILLVIGAVLALMGIYQVLVLEQQARSVFETRNTHAAFLNLVALPASAYFLQTIANKAAATKATIVRMFQAQGVSGFVQQGQEVLRAGGPAFRKQKSSVHPRVASTCKVLRKPRNPVGGGAQTRWRGQGEAQDASLD